MTNAYREWRESEVHKNGAKLQNDADAVLDKRDAEPFVTVNDDAAGARKTYRKSVADAYIRKGQASTCKVYTSPNSQAYKDGWERIFGTKG